MGVISAGTVSVILVGITYSITLPLLLCIIFKKRFKACLKPFILGLISYLAFSFCLVNIINGLLLLFINTTEFSTAFIFIYSLCTQIIAVLIAQSGKYYTIKILRDDVKPGKYAMRGNALEFGTGFGGMEAIMTVGITMMSYMMYAGIFSGADIEELFAGFTGDELINMQMNFELLTNNGVQNMLVLVIKGLAMFIFQIGSSLLVYRAVFGPNDKPYFRLALIFHIMMVVPGCIVSAGIISSIWFEPIITLIFGAAVLYYSYDKIREYEKQYVKDRLTADKGKKTIHLK